MCFPKSVYLLVNPDNLSFKGFSTLFKMGGAMPLPSELKGMLPFLDAMEKRLKQGGVICIYPEAHIWPYCTWVRDFKNSSFKYPVKYDAPVYAFTNCYKKRLFGKKARMVTYIDGPFYPDKSLPAAERHIKLRDEVYEAMKKRAEKESDYSLIDYVKKEEIND
jgi:1-acyl-sn-glycerol-3-phosphate acyltransferase